MSLHTSLLARWPVLVATLVLVAAGCDTPDEPRDDEAPTQTIEQPTDEPADDQESSGPEQQTDAVAEPQPDSGCIGPFDTDGRPVTWQHASVPEHRTHPGVAYDDDRQVLVVFGGQDIDERGMPETDTWEYDGTDWQRVATADHDATPPSRMGPAMAYDPSAGQTVLFGGADEDDEAFDDT